MSREFCMLLTIQLSFVFSHATYVKRCKICDRKVIDWCQNLVRKRNENILRVHDLNRPLLNERIEMETTR